MNDYESVVLPSTFEQAKPFLRPVLRRCTDPFQEQLHSFVSVRITDFMDWRVVLELPAARVFVTIDMLVSWDVSAQQVVDSAVFAVASVVGHGIIQRPEYGLWQIVDEKEDATARLALPDFLNGFEEHVPGSPIAITPAPGVLLIGGDESAVQVERLLSLAWEVFRSSPRPLTPVPWRYDGSNLVCFEGKDASQQQRVHDAKRLLAAYEYAQQSDHLFEIEGFMNPVPPVSLLRKKGEEGRWTEQRFADIDGGAWLAETDYIVLCTLDGQWRLPMSAYRSLAKGTLERLPVRPKRYRAVFPSKGTLKRLKNHVDTEFIQ